MLVDSAGIRPQIADVIVMYYNNHEKIRRLRADGIHYLS